MTKAVLFLADWLCVVIFKMLKMRIKQMLITMVNRCLQSEIGAGGNHCTNTVLTMHQLDGCRVAVRAMHMLHVTQKWLPALECNAYLARLQ